MNERNKRTVKFHFAKKWKDKIFLIFYTYNFAHLHRRLISIERKMEFYFSEDIQKYHTKRKMYYPVANNHFVHLKKKTYNRNDGSYLFESTFDRTRDKFFKIQRNILLSTIFLTFLRIQIILKIYDNDATFLYHRYKAAFTSRDSPLS